MAGLAVPILLAAGAGLAAGPAALKYGAWGVDLTARDLNIRPGDDFLQYANGAWLGRTPIPADKSSVSLRLYESDLAETRLHAIMEDAGKKATREPATLEGKVGAFRSWTRAVSRPWPNRSPRELDAIRAAATREQLGALMGLQNDFEGGVFGVGVGVDIKDTSHYAVHLGQAGSACPIATTTCNPRSPRRRPPTKPMSRSC